MIATLAEIKSILGISDASLDSRIQALMPYVQGDIIDYCKNDFAISTANWTSDTLYFENSSKKIIDDSGTMITDGLLENATDIVVTHSLHNNKNFTVDSETAITETEIVVDENIVEEPNDDGYVVTVRGVSYPDGLKLIYASMINTKILMDNMSGGLISSKKLETFCVTYHSEDFEGGYAKIDLQALKKYRKISK
jgi:hypothetical protein